MNSFCTIPEAIARMKKGKLLILLDDPARENEGDLYIPTDLMTPKHITAMIQYGGGLICTAITKAQAARLSIPLMVPVHENREKTGLSISVSVDAKRGITTGVSAFDRAKTIQILSNSKSKESDLVRPGHVFGLVAKSNGVLEREGQTEMAVDLAKLADLTPAGVLCEIVGKNGRMARREELIALSKKLDAKIVSLRDLIRYRKLHNTLREPYCPDVVRISSSALPTVYGTFAITAYKSALDGREHAALVFGKPEAGALVRVHSQCLTGDTFFSLRCDCGAQLKESFRRIAKEGSGIIVYASQEGRGIGLGNKIKAYALQDTGLDTVEANLKLGFCADQRTYEAAADILKDQGINTVRLLSNNPEKVKQLRSFGITVTERIQLETIPNQKNIRYLRTKKRKMGHLLTRV